ncbi:MAG: hypothetical protein IIA67_07600 [Planctomycetes bacterium]|nr:hypothetical protein [Planctomycetota bacterium]
MIGRRVDFSSWRKLAPAAALVAVLALASAAIVYSQAADKTAGKVDKASAQPALRVGGNVDAAKIAGHAKCVDCHRSEVAAWKKSKHASYVFDLLLDPHAVEYAKKMGIEADQITHSSMCLNCHGTPMKNQQGHAQAIAGVSCEACHNPAGGQSGWLNPHAVYGPVGTRREAETPEHKQRRAERCRKAGQIRTSDLYLLAKRCHACHVVGNEKLVNEAEHKLSGDRFDLLKRMSGDVRHNFHLNRSKNALVSSLRTDGHENIKEATEARMRVVHVVGMLVKAETVLRRLAGAEDPEGDFAEGLAALFEETLDDLEDTDVDELADLADEHRDLCDRLLDADFETGDEDVLKAVKVFAKSAQQYAAGDGKGLKDFELPKLDVELKKAFQP